MSIYTHEYDFVKRCLELLNSRKEGSEVTELLCLSLGLLVFPKQKLGTDSMAVPDTPTIEEWGIDLGSITSSKDTSIKTVHDVAWHLRNSVCHGRFDITHCNEGPQIEWIHFHDKRNEDSIDYCFEARIKVDDFTKFVKKYAGVYLGKVSKL